MQMRLGSFKFIVTVVFVCKSSSSPLGLHQVMRDLLSANWSSIAFLYSTWYVENMKKIVKVEVLEDYKIDLTFADETKGVADLARLAGKGVFSLWGDYSEFRKVQIGSSGELIWGDQIDLCPDALYLEITGRHPADVFPALKPGIACA